MVLSKWVITSAILVLRGDLVCEGVCLPRSHKRPMNETQGLQSIELGPDAFRSELLQALLQSCLSCHASHANFFGRSKKFLIISELLSWQRSAFITENYFRYILLENGMI